jgi:hypothetical protein
MFGWWREAFGLTMIQSASAHRRVLSVFPKLVQLQALTPL